MSLPPYLIIMLPATTGRGVCRVPEQQPPSPESAQKAHPMKSESRTIVFMVVLSFVCALILSLLASSLAKPKEVAKDLDRSKEMMIAAKILDHDGHFLIQNEEGKYVQA